jgi:hypothetical protein
MAVNESGNLGHALREGLTDGSVCKTSPDRGGVVEDGSHASGYGSDSAMMSRDAAADRVHDGKFFGEDDQDTIYTWTKTDDIGRNLPYPSV